MIDVKKEISRYKPVDIKGTPHKAHDGIMAEAVQGFNKALKQIHKEQYKYSHQLGEVLEILDDLEGDNKAIEALEEKDKEWEKEKELLLGAILDLADSLEDIYSYAVRFGDEALENQMALQWKRVGSLLNQHGITRLEGVGAPFTPSLYVAKALEENPDIPHGQILGILRSGYLYRGDILRKGEIIVNKWEE